MFNLYSNSRDHVYPPRSDQTRGNHDLYASIQDMDRPGRASPGYERSYQIFRPGVYNDGHIGGRNLYGWPANGRKSNGFSDLIKTNPDNMSMHHLPDANASSENGGEHAGDNSGSPSKGISRLFSKFADKCSLNGIPFIKSSKNPKVKAVWSLLLLAAVGAMIFHLHQLFSTYFEFKTHSEIQLTFSNLQFPAVTICNVNPMRLSQTEFVSADLASLIDSVHPDKLELLARTWTPDYEEQENYFEDDDDVDDDDDDEEDYEKKRRKRKKRQSSSSLWSDTKVRLRKNNFFDDFSYSSILNITPIRTDIDDFYDENYGDSWYAEAETSSFSQVTDYFTDLLMAEKGPTRARIGHQIRDMLIQCSFDGGKCTQGNFTRFLSSSYGNCYTLSYNKFVSRRSGPRHGMELILYLETDEYIPGITQGKGAQVVIHEQGTLPFPDDEGLAIAPGMLTNIGIRQVEIQNLGDPYGQCTSTGDFQTTYGVKYTRNTCQKTCEQVRIRKQCNCYDEHKQEVNKLLKIPVSLSPCRNKAQLTCLARVEWLFQENSHACNCQTPCAEKKYEKTLSSREWPSTSFADVLIQVLCQELSAEACLKLKLKSDSEKRSEFIKLNIYYEDLNYELLDEQPDYELSQFLSDFGGTIGLWIGLSILSMFELFHLLTDIVLYICYGKWRKKNHGKGDQSK